jgi:hypothetical protein
MSTGPSAQNDRVCTACASGSFSIPNLNATPPQTAAATNATQCTAFATCALGTYIDNPGSATSNRTCKACDDGFFNATTTNAPNSLSCTPYTTCLPGEFIGTAGTKIADRVCAACAPSSYSTTSNALACVAFKACPAGTKIGNPGSASTDSKPCVACEDGYFSTTDDAVTCTKQPVCPKGSKITSDGSNTEPATCGQCGTGTTSTDPVSHDCAKHALTRPEPNSHQ